MGFGLNGVDQWVSHCLIIDRLPLFFIVAQWEAEGVNLVAQSEASILISGF